MNFTSFLNEGLIKLPENLKQDLYQFFLHSYLSYLYFLSNQSIEDELDKKLIDSVFKKLTSKYNVKPLDEALGKKLSKQKSYSKFFKSEIPEQYLKAYVKSKGKEWVNSLTKKYKDSLDMKCTIGFMKLNRDLDAQGVYHTKQNEIVISIPGLSLSAEQVMTFIHVMNTSVLVNKIDKALTVIDHELTHAIQSLILYDLHISQMDDKNHSMLSGKDKEKAYYTSQVEFDPTIKTAANLLKSTSNFSKLSLEDKKKRFNVFTWGDVSVGEIDNVSEDFRSNFFKHLKMNSIVQWKKAVKLLNSEIFK